MRSFIFAAALLSSSLMASKANASQSAEPVAINLSYSGDGILKEGESTTITGVVTSAKENKTFWDWLMALFGLGDNLQANGLELVATFPNESIDVSSQLQFANAGKDKIQFTFNASDLKASELNRFSLRVFDSKRDKNKLSRLLNIQSKVEKRLEFLKDLKEKHRHSRSIDVVIAIVDSYSATLQELIAKIQNRIASDESLVADYTLPLQVENSLTSLRRSGTKIDEFKLELISNPGTLIEGMSTNLKVIITKQKIEAQEKYYVPQILINGVSAYPDNPQKFTETSVKFELPIGPFLASQSTTVAVKVYKWNQNKGKLEDLVASLTMPIGVVPDNVAPRWLATSTPGTAQRYLTEPENLNFSVTDAFGRIDPTSIEIALKKMEPDGQVTTAKIEPTTIANLGYGQSYLFEGNAGILEEGEYKIEARVKDLKGNFAEPNPWVSPFVIDRTAPTIQLGIKDGSEFDSETLTIPVSIAENYGSVTEVFLNDTKVTETQEQTFGVNVTLHEGTNTIEVRSRDLAGNESLPQKLNSIIYHATPPALLTSIPAREAILATKQLPMSLNIEARFDRSIFSATANGNPLAVDDNRIFGSIQIASKGKHEILFEIARSASGKKYRFLVPVTVTVDGTAPKISSESGTVLTRRQTYDLPISISDTSDTFTEVWVNESKVFGTGAKVFSVNISLPNEGENEVKVTSQDTAGNSATPHVLKLVRDSIGPVISIASPSEADHLNSVLIEIVGSSNETIQQISANGTSLTIGGDGKTFSGTYLAPGQGPQSITITATDLAGNTGSTVRNLDISVPLLIKELVSVIPVNQNIWIKGSSGSARPGLPITATAGLFGTNSQSVVVSHDGSFAIRLSPFEQATLSIRDEGTGEEDSMLISVESETRLSGIVKDVDGNPLPGATISIRGSDVTTTTNGTGAFSLSNIPTGDQTLIINGQTIQQSSAGGSRTFSQLLMKVNIGARQENIIPNVIYLTPLIVDGSQTVISEGRSATVSSTHAPGVTIEIPANKVIFPDGSNSGLINIMTVPADRTPLPPPANAMPSMVVSLEPSGLKFKERVEIRLPNIYNMPPNAELALVSLNSTTGQWEIDGVAAVTPNGSEIISKPGQGISHFSLVYAAPVAPEFHPVVDSSIGAYNPSKDALSTRLELPFFKVGETKLTPSLTYKTTWARPTAYVSNTIEIPERKFSYTEKVTANDRFYDSMILGVRCGISWSGGHCHDLYVNYYRDTFFDRQTTFTSWYAPTSIKSQFYVADIGTTEVGPSLPPDPDDDDSLFSASETSGVISNEGTSVLAESLPLRNLISYSVELKNPNTNEYFKSGYYPTLARYRISLTNFTYTTTNLTVRDSRSISSNVMKNESRTNVTNYANASLSSNVLQGILPTDVASNIIVQNKVKSPAGQGWNIDGSQSILNPDSISPVIEDESGEVSTYDLNNVIETVYEPSASSGVKLTQGIDLKSWPTIYVTRINSSNEAQIAEDSAYGVSSPQTLSTIPGMSGVTANSGLHSCIGSAGNRVATKHSYKYAGDITSLVRMPDGTFLGLNKREWNFFSVRGSSYARMAWGYNGNTARNLTPEAFDSWCKSEFGQSCGPGTVYYSGRCGTNVPAPLSGVTAGQGWFARNQHFSQPVANKYFSMEIGIEEPTGRAHGLNDPSALAMDSNGNVYIADSGNNIVYKLDPAMNRFTWLAGNNTNLNFPDEGGTAIRVPVYHPRSLTTDRSGNVFIGTEKGNIIKVDAGGMASWVGGRPLEEGGIYANQGHISQIALNNPLGMVVDDDNNDLYVADTGFHRVLRINLASGQADVVAGNGTCNPQNRGDGNPATTASLCSPQSLFIDADKNLIIVESGRNVIRKVIFNRTPTSRLSFRSRNGTGSVLSKNIDGTWEKVERDGTKAHFSPEGRLTKSISNSGLEVTYSYDTSGRITEISFPTGQALTYTYSTEGHLIRVTDPAGRASSFDYSAGKLSRVNFPDGTRRSYSYNQDQLLEKEVNQRGGETKYEYNEHLRFTAATLPGGSKYEASDFISATISGTDSQPRTLSGMSAVGGQSTSSIKSAKGQTTEFTYDLSGSISSTKDAKGNVTVYKRDFSGLLYEQILPNGNTRKFTYSPGTSDITEIWEHSPDGRSLLLRKTTYTPEGRIRSSKEAGKPNVAIEYGLNGLPTKIQTGGELVQYIYGPLDLISSVTRSDASGRVLTTTYNRNANGWITSIKSPDGTEVLYEYDPAGNRTATLTWITPSKSAKTLYTYDDFNRISKITSPNGEETNYTYLPTGELQMVVDHTGRETKFEYDLDGKLLRKILPNETELLYSYDTNGNLITETDAKGQTKVYEYNENNLVVRAILPDDEINYQYDVEGRVIEISNRISSVQTVYDSFGNISGTRQIGRNGLSAYPQIDIAYTYNADGKIASSTSYLGTIGFEYDSNLQLVQINGYSNASFSISYDPSGRIERIVRPQSITTTDYSLSGKAMNIKHKIGETIFDFVEYSYNGRDHLSATRSPAGQSFHSYDLNGQLTNSTGVLNEAYSYDDLGNRISDTRGNLSYHSNAKLLVSDPEYTYQYDANGNVILKLSKTADKDSYQYIYNSNNQLIETSVFRDMSNVQRIVKYSYDPLNRRIQRELTDLISPSRSNTIRYVYEGDRVIAELNSDNQTLARHTHGPGRTDDPYAVEVSNYGVNAGMSKTPGIYYLHKDSLGSVTSVTDSSGKLVQRLRYGSYGNLISIAGSNSEVLTEDPPLRLSFSFTGREWDNDTKLYYFRARYYDPKIGRFLQEDPHPGKLAAPVSFTTKYSYAANNPLLYKDPGGDIFGIDDVFIWMAIGATIGAADIMLSGEWDFWKIFEGATQGAMTAYLMTWSGGAVGQTSTGWLAAGAAAQASVQNGSFVKNFWRTGSYAFSIGAFLGFSHDYLRWYNHFYLEWVAPVAEVLMVVAPAYSIYDAGCNPKYGSWPEDICELQ